MISRNLKARYREEATNFRHIFVQQSSLGLLILVGYIRLYFHPNEYMQMLIFILKTFQTFHS